MRGTVSPRTLRDAAGGLRAADCCCDLGDRLDFQAARLSSGEKQRVAIARTLANDPAVIPADEPTANLERPIGHEVMRLLRGIAREQNRGVIILSHDERIKDVADRVLWLDDRMLKSVSERAVDPVCGMSVDQVHAVPAEFEGVTYYFCPRGCRDEFRADPKRFTRSSATPDPHEMGVSEPPGRPA